LYAINLEVYHVFKAQKNNAIIKKKPVCLDRSPVIKMSVPCMKSVKKTYPIAKNRIPGKNTQKT
jgi:hypothetical protein